MALDTANLVGTTVTGSLFKDKDFRYIHTYSVHETHDVTSDDIYAEYCFMYQIGNEFKTHFKVLARRKEALKELPMYLILFIPEGVEELEADSNEEYWFFVGSISDLNAFLKEMNPLIEIAKYREIRYEKAEN